MYKIIIPKDKNLNSNEKKFLYDRIPYIDESISAIVIKNRIIYISTTIKNKNYLNQLKKKILKIVYRLNDYKNFISHKVLYESKKYKIKKKINAYKILIKTKNLSKVSEGVYSIQKNLLKMYKDFDNSFLKYAKKSGYKEFEFSGVLDINSLIKNSYIHTFPNHCLFLSNIKRNDKILKKVPKINVNQNDKIRKLLENPETILSPTVCYNCFETLKKQKIKNNLKITSIGKCFRNESLNYFQLERLKVYSMRELIFFGNKHFVEKQIKDCIEFIKTFLNKNKIMYRISTATDPFFLDKDSNKKIYQLTNNLKLELEMYLPFEKKWIAVGSFNNHLDTLVKKYEIKKNKNYCNSGCIGIGYERFLYAFYAQRKMYKII